MSQSDLPLSFSAADVVGNIRMRRNRQHEWSRRLMSENTLSTNDLIWPIFIMDGKDDRQAIPSMPGVFRYSVDNAVKEVERASRLGIPAVALFPYTNPKLRDETGTEALNSNNLVCTACRAVKERVGDVGIITDVALDPYTSHGHDGVMEGNEIVNDASVELLVKQAINQASAGADVIAPSDMMDGRVGAIRHGLDQNGYQHIQILAYSAKYASAFYGPFRDAVGSSGTLKGDKRTYQMDPANSDEALRESELDISEGADMLMVKPGMPYLDIIRRLKDNFQMPTYAYQVSGEFAMIEAAAANGWIDREKAIFESLLAFKRAGCDGILTYFAPEIAERLNA